MREAGPQTEHYPVIKTEIEGCQVRVEGARWEQPRGSYRR